MNTTALPEDDADFDRWVIRGEPRERARRFRGRHEAVTLARILFALQRWNDAQPTPRGEVLIDVGYVLRETPLTAVGIPLSVASADLVAESAADTMWVRGLPLLAVEFVDQEREPYAAVFERLVEYRLCGIHAVWVVDPTPEGRTVQVHTRGGGWFAATAADVLTAETSLPGFACPVADFFR